MTSVLAGTAAGLIGAVLLLGSIASETHASTGMQVSRGTPVNMFGPTYLIGVVEPRDGSSGGWPSDLQPPREW